MVKKKFLLAIHFAKLIYTPLSFIFIFYFSWINRELLFKMATVANPAFLIFSALSWGILHLLSPLFPKVIFTYLNCSIEYMRLLEIHLARLPARYLPGGIWHTAGRLADYYHQGISKKQLAILAAFETILPAVVTFLIGGGYLWALEESSSIRSAEGVFSVISLGVLIFGPIILKIREKRDISTYIVLIATCCLFWVMASISFLFYYVSLNTYTTEVPLLKIAATYIFSWGVGYITIFAPQGLGVFEFVAGKLMHLPMSLGGAIAFMAGFRLVSLVADTTTYLIFLFIKKILKK